MTGATIPEVTKVVSVALRHLKQTRKVKLSMGEPPLCHHGNGLSLQNSAGRLENQENPGKPGLVRMFQVTNFRFNQMKRPHLDVYSCSRRCGRSSLGKTSGSSQQICAAMLTLAPASCQWRRKVPCGVPEALNVAFRLDLCCSRWQNQRLRFCSHAGNQAQNNTSELLDLLVFMYLHIYTDLSLTSCIIAQT